MNSLNEILTSCLEREIIKISIAGNKLYPFDDEGLYLKSNGTSQFFRVCTEEEKVLLTFSSLHNNIPILDFTVEYMNGIVYRLSFKSIEIYFKNTPLQWLN